MLQARGGKAAVLEGSVALITLLPHVCKPGSVRPVPAGSQGMGREEVVIGHSELWFQETWPDSPDVRHPLKRWWSERE